MTKKEKIRDLSCAEAARLAGAIWIHGAIDVEYHKAKPEKLPYYYPRIMLSMANPLPYDYQRVAGGEVRPGERGYFTLEIGTKDLVEKRLREILPFMGGEERKQIEIALKIIMINRIKRYKKEKTKEMQMLEELYNQWKECRERLEVWIKDFKTKYQNVKGKKVPIEIWDKAYRLRDC